MPDFSYTPDLLSQLREQLRSATASGLPWMIEGAQRAYDYARANGADLPFDAKGNDIAGSGQPDLPPVPQYVADANAQTAGAIGQADPAVFQPAPPPTPAPAAGADTAAAPPATGATPSLEEDPAYQAFVRALGAERSAAENTTNQSVDAANRSLSLRLPQISDAGVTAREGIDGGYETRGLLRSGQHEVALSRQRDAEGAQTAAVQDQTAQQIASLRSSLAEREAGFDSRQAEQNLAASGRLQASQDAQRTAAVEQQGQAALLAQQQRNNDLLDAQFRASQGQPAATPTAAAPAAQSSVVQNATAANPVGIVPAGGPDPSDPDYITKLIAQMQGH